MYIFFKEGILLDITYLVKTPAHENTFSFKVNAYHWSDSWANVVMKWAGRVTENLLLGQMKLLNFLTYIKDIIGISEPVLLMKIINNKTINVLLTAETDEANSYPLFQVLKWKEIYKLTKRTAISS